jgi:drug/metabolite transporter (DMT)-like permease
VLPVALGLGAAACIGIGDFAAGVASRRLPPVLVGFWAQGIALVFAVFLLGLFRPPFLPEQGTWGLGAGLASGVGIALLYRAMALGAISLVTPITACSVAVPVIYAVATGETLTTFELAGVVAIIAGVALASVSPGAAAELAAAEHGGRNERRAIVLSIASALSFGLFFVVMDLAPDAPGWASLWTAGTVRAAAFGVQAGLVLLGPWAFAGPGRATGAVATAGLLDQLSLLLIGLGTMTNAYGIVTALIGLYPVITALLGIILLGERLTRLQSAGATLAMVGVILVSV